MYTERKKDRIKENRRKLYSERCVYFNDIAPDFENMIYFSPLPISMKCSTCLLMF